MRVLVLLTLFLTITVAVSVLPLRIAEKRVRDLSQVLILQEIGSVETCAERNPCTRLETCCNTAQGPACCSSREACCCPDQQHCCASGYECNCFECPGDNCVCTGCTESGMCAESIINFNL